MNHFAAAVMTCAGVVLSNAAHSQMAPGPVDLNGQKVLTFVGKDPPGQRCNDNIQRAVACSSNRCGGTSTN